MHYRTLFIVTVVTEVAVLLCSNLPRDDHDSHERLRCHGYNIHIIIFFLKLKNIFTPLRDVKYHELKCRNINTVSVTVQPVVAIYMA